MPASPAYPAAPIDPTDETEVPVARWRVYVYGPEEDFDEERHRVDYLIPLAIHQGSGSQSVDAASFLYDLGWTEERAASRIGLDDLGWQVQLRALDDEDEPSIIKAWGIVTNSSVELGSDGEGVVWHARIDHNLWGQPLNSYPVLGPDGVRVDVQTPLVWNPMTLFHGQYRLDGNLSKHTDADINPPPDEPKSWRFLVDPQSMRTRTAITAQDEDGIEMVSLAQAAFNLCWWCNPDQKWINNPETVDEVAEAIGGHFPTALRGQFQSYGEYLPRNLEQLLYPHGCSFGLSHSLDRDGKRLSKIVFFRRGTGIQRAVNRARESTKTVQNTDAYVVHLEQSVATVANKVRIHGDVRRVEDTFHLFMAWPPADDSLRIEELIKGKKLAAEKPDVGRKLVANEGGDYTGLRPEIVADWWKERGETGLARWRPILDYEPGDVVRVAGPDNWEAWLCVKPNTNIPPTTDPEVTEWRLLGNDVLSIKRRRFLPCITEKPKGDDATSNRYVLEYFSRSKRLFRLKDWVAGAYAAGEFVVHLDAVYKARVATVERPSHADWEYIRLADPPEWASGTVYHLGDEVYEDGLTWVKIRSAVGGTGAAEPHLAYHEWAPTDGFNGQWLAYTDAFSVLEHECGVRFDTEHIPSELWSSIRQGLHSYWRITASIEVDSRLDVVVEPKMAPSDPGAPTSPLVRVSANPLDVEMVLQMEQRFQHDRVMPGSKFSGVDLTTLARDVFPPGPVRNDGRAAYAYALEQQTLEDAALLAGDIPIEGVLHPEYELGQLITQINGLDIKLDQAVSVPSTFPTPHVRPLQVVGISENYSQGQMMTLHLEVFKPSESMMERMR